MINRDIYLNQLISRKNNGLIKVVTGIRRCGKSYLLDPIFKDYLLSQGVSSDHIIKIELDREENVKYHNDSKAFSEYIKSLIIDDEMYYILLDEIQLVEGFEFILNGLLYKKNVDVYVTGSNSKFLSSDIITEFRGRGDQIHVMPLSFSEFYNASQKDKYEAWDEYITYGGMPIVLTKNSIQEKSSYLKELFEYTYIKDIIDRNDIKRTDILDSIINLLSSSVGSLTNPQKIYDTFKSNGEKELSINTVNSYLRFIEDSFIVSKASRYDVKGRKYISTPNKYYFSDLGLRNARLNFRQQEESHLMENAIYNELIIRGYNVDVGVVELREKNNRVYTEIDFVCNLGYQRYYIQSALNVDTMDKIIQESKSLNNTHDSFTKIIVVKGTMSPWKTDDGILIINIFDFLLDKNSLEKY